MLLKESGNTKEFKHAYVTWLLSVWAAADLIYLSFTDLHCIVAEDYIFY